MADDPDFAAFYEANYERLLMQLFAATASLADAEDVVHEAFTRACVRWRRLHPYDAPPAWVRRVAFHLALRGLWHTRRSLGLGGRPDPTREPPRLTAGQHRIPGRPARRAGHRWGAQRHGNGWAGHRVPRRSGLRRMPGDGRVRGGATVVRWLLAATTALAVVALAGCNADHGQRTSGVPSTASAPPATGRPAQYAYYAQAVDFTGPDAWQEAQRQAQQLRAKRFPATVYSSHTEFPTHTLYFFVAVASGEFHTREQAQAQVERLRRAGFTDAKVFEISLPK